jgi:hypothetical protein
MKKLTSENLKKEIDKLGIDLFICASSFETRCFSVPNAVGRCNISQVLLTFTTNESQKIIENSKELQTILKSDILTLPLDTDDPIGNYNLLNETFHKVFDKDGQLVVLLDTTSFTHEMLLLVFKLLYFYESSISALFVTYVGATSYSFNSTDENEKWLSKGIKDIRTVIGYPGYTDPTKEYHLIILFGFESERTKKIIESFEFSRLSIGYAEVEDSILGDHQKINKKRHSDLLELYPHAESFQFSLIDCIATKNAVLKQMKKEFNNVVSPLNNKISTLGVALACFCNPDLQITYAQANIYNEEAYSKPAEEIYFGKIELSEL